MAAKNSVSKWRCMDYIRNWYEKNYGKLESESLTNELVEDGHDVCNIVWQFVKDNNLIQQKDK